MSVATENKKVLFVSFKRQDVREIKDILLNKKQYIDLFFEDGVQEARDTVASDSPNLIGVFVKINAKKLDSIGIAGVCGYIVGLASLIQDAMESNVSVVLVCPNNATLFGEIDAKQNENFIVVRDVKHISILLVDLIVDLIKKKKLF